MQTLFLGNEQNYPFAPYQAAPIGVEALAGKLDRKVGVEALAG